jgi:gliding motility-associated protein GldM
MSIPKEPRQLMINLMYLVLTAMLALNVSAEIINAFFMLDKGIAKNNKIVEHAVESVIKSMEETAKTKTQYLPLVEKAKGAKALTVDFHQYIDDMRFRMVDESGGVYVTADTEAEYIAQGFKKEDGKIHMQDDDYLIGKPSGKKDKDTPQRIFVSGDYGAAGKKDPQGAILADKIRKLKAAYMKFVEGLWEGDGIKGTIFADKAKMKGALEQLEDEMTLTSDENYKEEDHEGKVWGEYVFGHMPVAAIYPMLRKFQNDARTSEAAVVNYLASQMGKLELNYDKFDVFSQSPKPYILLGETYEAEIALGAYSSQSKFTVSVGGSSLKIVDGKAKYSSRGSSVGEKKYSAKISVNNPLTGETETFTKEFSYEVGQPSVNVSADKMNVFYIGVDNPVTVAAAGVSTSAMTVKMTGGTLTKKSGTNYIAKGSKPGKVTIVVKDTKKNKSFPFEFRMKRIPDPIVRLGKKTDGLIGSGEMKAQPGLAAWLDNFDFDARCQVQSYTMYYTRKRQDPVEIEGKGGRFSGKVQSAIRQAKPGDQYSFTNVKARCPGDKAGRRVNGLAFKVK